MLWQLSKVFPSWLFSLLRIYQLVDLITYNVPDLCDGFLLVILNMWNHLWRLMNELKLRSVSLRVCCLSFVIFLKHFYYIETSTPVSVFYSYYYYWYSMYLFFYVFSLVQFLFIFWRRLLIMCLIFCLIFYKRDTNSGTFAMMFINVWCQSKVKQEIYEWKWKHTIYIKAKTTILSNYFWIWVTVNVSVQK